MLLGAVRAGALLACAGLGNALGNRQVLRQCAPTGAPTSERVSVCVPARNEAHHIAALVTDLRRQHNVARLQVLVGDDASADDTLGAATRAAEGDPRVHVERWTDEPAAGWLGKPAACHRLALNASARADPSVLVFVDADVRLAPEAIAAGIELLRANQLDLVSPWPSQTALTVVERLIQPLQQWSWLTTLPLGIAARSTRPSMAAVCGQFLVVDAVAYTAVGGHAAVAGCVLEDLELARALRRNGYRTAPADGSRLARCRMYSSSTALRAGYGKSLWTAFGSPRATAAMFGVLLLTYVLPPVAAALGSGPTRRWGLIGYLAAVGSRLVSARIAGTQTLPDALTQPLSVLGLAVLTADSHRRHRRGTLQWKGRHLA